MPERGEETSFLLPLDRVDKKVAQQFVVKSAKAAIN
jgi:hypothetical protein